MDYAFQRRHALVDGRLAELGVDRSAPVGKHMTELPLPDDDGEKVWSDAVSAKPARLVLPLSVSPLQVIEPEEISAATMNDVHGVVPITLQFAVTLQGEHDEATLIQLESHMRQHTGMIKLEAQPPVGTGEARQQVWNITRVFEDLHDSPVVVQETRAWADMARAQRAIGVICTHGLETSAAQRT